jgi:uncharacterized oxidoreductase
VWVRDHRVLITGGSAGIGLALAQAFLERGNQVLAVARSSERLRAATERLPRLQTATCDVANQSDLQRLISVVQERLGGLSILVNNAGIQRNDVYATTPTDTLLQHIGEEIDTNFTGLVKLTALALPLLQQAPEAVIVNVSSVLALAPKQSAPVYCATKAAVRSFTVALRYQLEDTAPDIRVVEVVPPMVDTDMTRGRSGTKLSPKEVAEEVLEGLATDKPEIQLGLARSFARLQRLSPALAARRMRRR